MDEVAIEETLERLKKLSYEDQFNEIENYPVQILELLASRVYKTSQRHFRHFRRIGRFGILDNILFKRVIKLNNNFEWTNENKQKFLNINDKFMQVFEASYNEALSIADVLENRIKNNDKFIKDYEIEIKIAPYMGDEFYNDDLTGIGDILSEPEPHFSPINFSFGHSCFDHETPIYLDKSFNWNIEYFGDTFKDNYICYEIHELLDTHRWSFCDIIKINEICADVEVTHQHYIENI
jgi:hypothetical protein